MTKKDLKKCTEFLEDTPDHQELIIVTVDEDEVLMQFAGVTNPNNLKDRTILVSMLLEAATEIQQSNLVEVLTGKDGKSVIAGRSDK